MVAGFFYITNKGFGQSFPTFFRSDIKGNGEDDAALIVGTIVAAFQMAAVEFCLCCFCFRFQGGRGFFIPQNGSNFADPIQHTDVVATAEELL